MPRSFPLGPSRTPGRIAESGAARSWSAAVAARLAGPVLGLLALAALSCNPARAQDTTPEPPSIGRADAPVTVVEYGDFSCGFCRTFNTTVKADLIRDYVDTGKVRFVWKHFPILNRASGDAAIAAACVHQQGAFWAYHDRLYGDLHGTGFALDALRKGVEDLGLDVTAFDACYAAPATEALVRADFEEAEAFGAYSTPTFRVNGKPVVGAQPFIVWQNILDATLAELGVN